MLMTPPDLGPTYRETGLASSAEVRVGRGGGRPHPLQNATGGRGRHHGQEGEGEEVCNDDRGSLARAGRTRSECQEAAILPVTQSPVSAPRPLNVEFSVRPFAVSVHIMCFHLSGKITMTGTNKVYSCSVYRPNRCRSLAATFETDVPRCDDHPATLHSIKKTPFHQKFTPDCNTT